MHSRRKTFNFLQKTAIFQLNREDGEKKIEKLEHIAQCICTIFVELLFNCFEFQLIFIINNERVACKMKLKITATAQQITTIIEVMINISHTQKEVKQYKKIICN